MTPRTKTAPRRASQLARFGPLAIILVALALVAVVVSTGDGGGAPTKLKPSTAGSSNGDLPITWGEAKAAGTTEQIKWGTKCDQKTGRATVPSTYAPPCVVARPGVAAPLPAKGASATTITVVAYELADDDLSASLSSLLDSKDAQRDTRTKFIELFERRFEMWGRKIKIVFFKGTGSDETSARADAVTVATEIGAFASIGGPGQQGAYAEELASRGVICIGCGLALPDSAVQDNAPYLWGSSMTPEQFLPILGDYTIGRLLNRKAKFAGDPEARFARIRFTAPFDMSGSPSLTLPGGATPAGLPLGSDSCGAVTTGEPHDGVSLELDLQPPANAAAFEIHYRFYTHGWPSDVCTKYNDQFAVLLSPPPVGDLIGNVAVDTKSRPLTVSSFTPVACDCGLGGCPGSTSCEANAALLDGTGFSDFGAATEWLAATVPFATGTKKLTLRVLSYDAGDPNLDTTVLVDGFAWRR